MTFSVDFRPRRDGQPYDPASFGGSVDNLAVYDAPARAGVPITTAGPAQRVEFGLYRFTVNDLPDGTYYTVITWREAAGATPYADRNDQFRLPVPDPSIARLRRLIAEPTQDDYTDSDLVRVLDANTWTDFDTALTHVDVYAAAADVWDEKAAVAQAGSGAVVTSVRSGDQAITYSDSTATHAARMARQMRSRSIARSTDLGRRRRIINREQQIDAGLGHLTEGVL